MTQMLIIVGVIAFLVGVAVVSLVPRWGKLDSATTLIIVLAMFAAGLVFATYRQEALAKGERERERNAKVLWAEKYHGIEKDVMAQGKLIEALMPNLLTVSNRLASLEQRTQSGDLYEILELRGELTKIKDTLNFYNSVMTRRLVDIYGAFSMIRDSAGFTEKKVKEFMENVGMVEPTETIRHLQEQVDLLSERFSVMERIVSKRIVIEEQSISSSPEELKIPVPMVNPEVPHARKPLPYKKGDPEDVVGPNREGIAAMWPAAHVAPEVLARIRQKQDEARQAVAAMRGVDPDAVTWFEIGVFIDNQPEVVEVKINEMNETVTSSKEE